MDLDATVDGSISERDYELLSQYLDGELPAHEVRDLERRLHSEPALNASLSSIQHLNNSIRNVFNVPGAEKVPLRVSSLLDKPVSNVLAFPQKAKQRWGFALAASILATSGLLLFPGLRFGVVAPQMAENVSADAILAEALEGTPSSGTQWNALADGRQVRALLSFPNIEGGWCREYLLLEADGDQLHGLACRSGEGWINEVVEASEMTDASTEYRTATAGDSDIAVSHSDEAALIADHWQ